MSTTQGTDARTGTTENASRPERVKADKALQAGASRAQLSLQTLGKLIGEARDLKVHEDPKVTDDAGRTFRTWAAYLANRLKAYPLVDKAVRGKFVDELIAAGMSARAISEATGGLESKSAVNRKQQAAKRAARPNDGTDKGADSTGTQDQPGLSTTAAQDATKAATQAVNALAKVVDKVADMSDEDMDRVIASMTATATKLSAMRKLRRQQAAKVEQDAAKVEQDAAKVTPADMPAKVA